MNYSPSIQIIVLLADHEAQAGRFPQILPPHILLGTLKFAEIDPFMLTQMANQMKNQLGAGTGAAGIFQQEQQEIKNKLKSIGLNSTLFRRALRSKLGRSGGPPVKGPLHRSPETKQLFANAQDLARQEKAQMVSPRHFITLLLEKPATAPGPPIDGNIAATLLKQKESPQPDIIDPNNLPPTPAENNQISDTSPTNLASLVSHLKELRNRLRETVFGQEHAIRDFTEGLFNAEVTAGADTTRKAPRGLFVFAGPPGVGKTFLAQSGAEALGKPFKRFDMSGYSDHQAGHTLMGMQKSYKDASPGLLTGFVEQNPNAILLFDEIEKAHLNILQLFLQILDAGTLEDKYHERNISFKDTIIIFTTNAGKALYETGNSGALPGSGAKLHRRTILGALEKEIDPRTHKPIFPQAICSRMATGYPILFNHLGISHLVRLVQKELDFQGELLYKTYGKPVEFTPETALCLVMQEGIGADARTLKAQARIFVNTEMFKLGQLYKPDRFNQVMNQTAKIRFQLESKQSADHEINQLFTPAETVTVLVVADKQLCNAWEKHIPGVRWKQAADIPAVLDILAAEEVDIVLLDLWVENESTPEVGPLFPAVDTLKMFDHLPVAARGLAPGREILRIIHEKHPHLPCYLLSFSQRDGQSPDEELLLACMRWGGVRGVLEAAPLAWDQTNIPEDDIRRMSEKLSVLKETLWQENRALDFQAQRKALAFDTVPGFQTSDGTLLIRLRNLRITRTLAAEDVSEVLDEVDRPDIGFDDVYGADSAKTELRFIVDWLKDPKKFKSLGFPTPKGILLYGVPGTGKTMLARALAGECGVAFMTASATDFVTKWQGSGPQNVRDLFARARRYAPAIVFIDEIDAIGKKRVGSMGSSGAAEQTLNALLTEMDGFKGGSDKPVITLAATNLVDMLDEALLRRFSRSVEVDAPDRAARRAYLENRLAFGKKHRVSADVLDRVAMQTAQSTIAKLERIVELALRLAVDSGGIVTDELLEEAFEKMRMGEAKSTGDADSLLRVARHETGHCILAWHHGEIPIQITIMARGGAGGFVENEAKENVLLHTREDLLKQVRQLLAGRAAEMFYYGVDHGLSTGASNDLERATYIIVKMISVYGMDEEYGLLALGTKYLKNNPLPADIVSAARRMLANQMDQTLTVLKANRDKCDNLIAALMEKNRLTRPQITDILGPKAR